MKYTKDIHAKNVLEILEQTRTNACDLCAYTKKICTTFHDNRERTAIMICNVCRQFVGLPKSSIKKITRTSMQWGCPCHALGKEAIKRTWIALEEGGYLE